MAVLSSWVLLLFSIGDPKRMPAKFLLTPASKRSPTSTWLHLSKLNAPTGRSVQDIYLIMRLTFVVQESEV